MLDEYGGADRLLFSADDYNELCRRFLADSVDFSLEKLKESGVNKEYINIDLQKCIEDIIRDIKREMQS